MRRDLLLEAVRLVGAYLKTEAHYRHVLSGMVNDLYRGKMDAGDFASRHAALIEEQFRRAWNEGARSVGFDPAEMEDDELLPLIDLMQAEQEYIYQFADDIEAARAAGSGMDGLLRRVDMWAARYGQIADQARIFFGKRHRLIWRLGATEQHCRHCLAFNNVVATAAEWEASGWYPKSEALECGGWQCDCSLEPTNKYRTKGGIPQV